LNPLSCLSLVSLELPVSFFAHEVGGWFTVYSPKRKKANRRWIPSANDAIRVRKGDSQGDDSHVPVLRKQVGYDREAKESVYGFLSQSIIIPMSSNRPLRYVLRWAIAILRNYSVYGIGFQPRLLHVS